MRPSTRGVADRLLFAELESGRVEVGHVGALVVRGNFKRTAGAGGCLLENEGDVFARESLRLGSGVLSVFQIGREREKEFNLVRGEVQKLQETYVF